MSNAELARRLAGEIAAARKEPVLTFALERGEPDIFSSKAGGTPYLPRGTAWPLDGRGQGMALLAQVDCTELSGLPDFPHTGLLQFFHALDEVYGAVSDDQTSRDGFRVLYHEQADSSVTEEEVLDRRPPQPSEGWYTPLCGGPCRIVFSSPAVQPIPDCDFRAWREFLSRWNELHGTAFRDQWEYCKATKISRIFPSPEGNGPLHQLGGYPFFTQYDPRPGRYEDLDTLLFQLDSDMPKDGDLVLWGDAGIGNFFISRDALKRRDFSRVMYTWDCG